MNRRAILKLSVVASSALLFPNSLKASNVDFTNIEFSHDTYSTNKAQTIIIFLYGAPSQLSGNLTNIEAIKEASQSDYDRYFRDITLTQNSCWQEAGGSYMEELLADGDMSIFRTCYSKVREEEGNKAHGVCVSQNQKGSFMDGRGGIVSSLAEILEVNGVVDENTVMPFVTLEGDSDFYLDGEKPLSRYLKPVGINEKLDNPYSRSKRDRWYYYTQEERDSAPQTYSKKEGGFDPQFEMAMDDLAQSKNKNEAIRTAFEKREGLSQFIETIKEKETPDLGEDAYLENNVFAKKLETSIKIVANNPDTKLITLSSGSLGGWDDHNDAQEYVSRMEALFKTLKSAMAHLKVLGKDKNVNIMLFGEFGRNVNLNSAFGWDHGNLQNFFVLGGQDYFQHQGVVGETFLDDVGAVNRLYLKPKEGTYQFEPLSIASTIYKIYGIENPEILCDGYAPVSI